MIDHLDAVLQHLFRMRVAALRPPPPEPVLPEQIGFGPPDQAWRTLVKSQLGTRSALNVYLLELRDNRRLRSNERLRSLHNGVVHDTPAPARLDCHYLISAWSPVADPSDAALHEHRLLYDTLAVLTSTQPLVPRAVFAPAPLPPDFPAALADAELPTVVAPVEGFPKYAELWGTMGETHPWKPAVYLIVTLPVLLPAHEVGPVVTTRIIEYRRLGDDAPLLVWTQIGGRVLDASTAPAAPVGGAWVRLESVDGAPLETVESDALGQFTFTRVQPGTYHLRARAQGQAELLRAVSVPSPTGEYDLTFN